MRSQHQRLGKVSNLLGAVVFDSTLVVRAEEVKPQAVLTWVDLVKETKPEASPLLRIDQALEHGVLNSLTDVFAGFCHSP